MCSDPVNLPPSISKLHALQLLAAKTRTPPYRLQEGVVGNPDLTTKRTAASESTASGSQPSTCLATTNVDTTSKPAVSPEVG